MKLTPTEQRLMRVLALAEGRWVSQDHLIRSVWPHFYQGGSLNDDSMPHTLRVNICRLRKKLSATSSSIENDYGRGCYRLVGAQQAVA